VSSHFASSHATNSGETSAEAAIPLYVMTN
jgi:hypothetical protein